ncbi:hypothetical protein MTO96_038944 [Rhipicephalus appendiculatus]
MEALPLPLGEEVVFGLEKMSQSPLHLFYGEVHHDLLRGSLDVLPDLRRPAFEVDLLLALGLPCLSLRELGVGHSELALSCLSYQ